MHSTFTFNPSTRPPSNYQQQPIYNIGAPPTSFVTHRQPNLFLNHQAFTRSFASVVSCDQAKHPNMSADNNSGILGSIFKHFKQPTTPHYRPSPLPPPAQSQNKEFEDFTHMPSVNNLHTYNPHIYQQPPTHHIKVESSGQLQQQVKNNNLSYAAATTNFMASFFVGCQQRQGPPRPRKPWFNKGFRCRGGRWGGKNQFNSRFHQNDVKHSHEKERSSIERDIQDDSSCDFVHVVEDKEVKLTTNSPNETAKGSCYSKPSDDPPFMIYSLEDFPAITTSMKKQTAVGKKQPSPGKSDEGFVVVPTEASISTPSFTPKRISLCEKFIKSPAKMFPKPMLPMVLKPCLKPTRRRVSECSDDFIVFANDDCDNDQDEEDDDCSDVGSETSDDDSDDDIFEEDEETSSDESDEEEAAEETSQKEEVDECDNKRSETPQADSGVEERRVHFSLKPKVHVMRVWDYAYRAYRKGDYWQQVARDHERFRKRITEQLEEVLSPILDDEHREKIYRERFQ